MDRDAKYVKLSIVLLTVLGILIFVGGIFLFRDMAVNAPERIELIKITLSRYGIPGLFIASILGGTILPMGVPGLVVYATGFGLPLYLVVLSASAGFTIGVTFNYYLAKKYGKPFVVKRVGKERFEDMSRWWDRYGVATYLIFGLIPGLPFDLLAFICGILNMPLSTFWIISFGTRVVQFTAFAYLGSFFGKLIGLI